MNHPIDAPNEQFNEDDNIEDITESERVDGTYVNHKQVEEYESTVASFIL